jgi:hypothetical protein
MPKKGTSERHVKLRVRSWNGRTRCAQMGLQGSPWPFGNSSISGPMNREWLEHILNLLKCKWGTRHIGGKLTYEGTMALSK